MRVLFLFLVFANLAYFFWHYQYGVVETGDVELTAPNGDSSVAPLVLLEEAQSGPEQPARPEPPPEPEPQPPPAVAEAVPDVCYRAGKLDTKEEAQGIARRLRDAGAETALEEEVEVVSQRFWLHTQVFDSRQAALDMMAEFRRRGIRDLALVRSGEWQNSISLGLYKSQTSTQRRIGQLRDKDIEPVVEEQQQTRTDYWVHYRTAEDNSDAQAAWTAIAAANKQLTRESQPCQ